MAQILAAFVSPNDPAVARVLKDAARLLEAGGHDGSASAGRYNESLLPKGTFVAMMSEARTKHYANTLPLGRPR